MISWPATVVLSVLPVALLALGLLAPRVVPWWDFLMGLGLAAAGGLIVLPVVTARFWRRTGHAARYMTAIHHLHRYLSFGLGVAVLVHTAGFLVLDSLTVEYIKISAPGYMLSGLVSGVLLIVLTVTSLFRLQWSIRYPAWRRWHAILSALTLALMLHHLIGAGYYFDTLWKSAGLILAALILTAMSLRGSASERSVHVASPVDADATPEIQVGRRTAFAMLALWLFAAALFAIPNDLETDEEEVACASLSCT